MNKIRTATALCAAAMGLVAITPKAVADDWDKKTVVTINEPMEVPGTSKGNVVLQPGTYVFKLLNTTDASRHTVIIQNERENHTFATILAIPNYRVRPTGKSVFAFWEVPAGQPQAVRAWFYPGDNFGQEFKYPKTRASEITQTAHEEVPAAEETAVAETAAPAPQTEIAQNTPPPAPVDNTPAPVAETPAPEPAPAPVVAENITPQTLPQTASNVPLLALFGLFSIGAALGVGVFARRSVKQVG